MHGGFLRALVPAQVVDAVGEVDVFFVEDGCPLEGCSYTTNDRTSAKLSPALQLIRVAVVTVAM